MKPDYDTIAGTYDRRYADNDYSGVETALAAFVGSDPRTRVLEAGCGTGHWLRMLDERSIRTAGLDLSARMLARAHALAPRVQLVRGTAEHLPWPGQSFDRVFCINALHHFEDKIAFLREAQRVLRGGGQMMTVGLDPHAGVDRWYIYDYFEPALEIDRRRYPSSGRLRAWMVAAGLRNVYTREVQHIPGRLSARAALDQGRLDKGRHVPAGGSDR